jgi:hypothetical protein
VAVAITVTARVARGSPTRGVQVVTTRRWIQSNLEFNELSQLPVPGQSGCGLGGALSRLQLVALCATVCGTVTVRRNRANAAPSLSIP